MFQYLPISSNTIRNLHNSQIYFNSPLYFNDPFDTFHQLEIKDLSNDKFIDLYCESIQRDFDKQILNGILDKTISKEVFYSFCEENIEYLIDLDESNSDYILQNKQNFLEYLSAEDEGIHYAFLDNICNMLLSSKVEIQKGINNNIQRFREQLSKTGISCFTKRNNNLLMWSHYANSHKGICLEFDTRKEPFSKAHEVAYQEDIPIVDSDLMFGKMVDNTQLIEKILSCKSLDWKPEEEIRVLHEESNKSYTYDSKLLKAIYFGLRSNKSDREIICALVKVKNTAVKFYKMEKIENKFEIEPIEFEYGI